MFCFPDVRPGDIDIVPRFELDLDRMVFHVDPQDRTDAFIGHDPFAHSRRLLLFAALLLAVAALQFP